MRPKGRSDAAERPWGRFPFFFQAATAAFSASTSSERSDPTRSLLEKLSQTSIHHPNYGFNLWLKFYKNYIFRHKILIVLLDWKWMYWNVSECIGSSWGVWKVKPIHSDTFQYILGSMKSKANTFRYIPIHSDTSEHCARFLENPWS